MGFKYFATYVSGVFFFFFAISGPASKLATGHAAT